MRDTIIYVGSIMLPDKNAAAQRALSLSKTFRNLGYKVVIVGRGEQDIPEQSVLSTKMVCQGFETYSIPQPRNMRQWAYHTVSAKEFIEVIKHCGIDRIKCVVVMEYEAIPLMKLVRYCKKCDIPLIADNLEWFGHSQRKFPMNIAKDVDTWLRMRVVYPKMVGNMICISRFLFDYFKDVVSNCVYIPGTIDQTEDKWNGLSYKTNDVLTIGYAGNPGIMFEKERLDYLIKAVSDLNAEGKPCRLLLAGIDDNFIRKNEDVAENVAKSNGMIVCKGILPHCEALEMIAACDFSVIIRNDNRVTNAGFPTKLSESFGCGTPVLTTCTSNISDYVVNKKWGIVCEGYGVDSIKATIERAMSYSAEELLDAHVCIKKENPLRYECFEENLRAFLAEMQ